jgi:hypothetical protein
LNLFLFSGDVRVRENISLSDVQPELKENEVLLNVSITLLE